MALVRSGRALEARPIFSRMLAVHGDSAELNVLLGQAHAQQGDFDAAVQVLRHALELKPDVPEAQGALGVIYLKQGKLPEAEAALRAELAIRPADTVSQYNLATVLELVEKPQEAEGLLRALLKARPDQADARYLLGKILLARGAADEARPPPRGGGAAGAGRSQVALPARPGLPEARPRRAGAASSSSCSRAQGQAPRGDAVTAAVLAVLLLAAPAAQRRDAPQGREQLLKLAASEMAAGQRAAAERHWRTAADRFSSVQALLQLARLAASAGNATGALADLRKALDLAPNSEEVLEAFAQVCLSLRRPDAGHRRAGGPLAPEPDGRGPPLPARRGAAAGRRLQARGGGAGGSERLDPQRTLTLIALGLAHNGIKRYDAGRAVLERALAREPDNVEALAALAESEEGRGDVAAAAAHAERALAQSPRTPPPTSCAAWSS